MRKWTKEEEQLLLANPDKTPKELAQTIFKGTRTAVAISSKRINMNFVPREKICPRCGKKFEQRLATESHCKICERKRTQQRRIKKQMALIEKKKLEEEKLIKELQSKSYICRRCNKEHPGTHFYYDRNTNDLRKVCKTCLGEQNSKLRKKRISEGREW